MNDLQVLTKDQRILTLMRFGEPDSDHGSDKLLCRTAAGVDEVVRLDQVKLIFGSYTFFNSKRKAL